MKNFKQTIMLMLVCALGFLASCSDEEDVFYYTFKNVEYTVETGDGVTTYDTEWQLFNTFTNNTQEVRKYSLENIYAGHEECFQFKCDTPEEFNPTPGDVHIPLPNGLSPDGTVSVGTMGEYTMDIQFTHTEADIWEEFDVPPMSKLSILRSLKIEKQVFTYTATFERHPKGKDYVVKGKFIHVKPISSKTNVILEDIE